MKSTSYFIKLLIVVLGVIMTECKEFKSSKQYHYKGQASFRRSYNGYKDWTDTEFDSMKRSNPTLMFSSNSSDSQALDILTDLKIANRHELMLEKINHYLKDTVFLASHNKSVDTVYLKYNPMRTKAVIQIENGQRIDSFPIEDEIFAHNLSLLKLPANSNSVIVFVNQYYIMNGDNYDVSVYEKKRNSP